MSTYYNEIDSYAAQWLRNLIQAGHIAKGEVDERSISDIQPDELTGFRQCHFFAGIGGWSLALRLAGWPDDRPVWTGSCPCQPFSVAGKRAGVDDERHLWPDWRWLIDQCRPATIFGEQVASKDGRTWLSGVRSDLEVMGYEVGAADLCAASIGAPHIRQRLWFVADTGYLCKTRSTAIVGKRFYEAKKIRQQHPIRFNLPRNNELANNYSEQHNGAGKSGQNRRGEFTDSGPWSDLEWLPCADGKARPIKPGIEPLAHGVSGRVGRLRAYGNAIVPQVAAEFIKAFMECRP